MNERFALLAELLSYPGGRTAAVAERLGVAESFRNLTPTGLQEIYTSTFDLQPACAPYFGHHLLGEDSPLRGPLLARLAGIYAAHGFVPREELGDHVAEVLRFLAVAPACEERDDLVRDGLLPALRKMIESLEGANPYRGVLALVERAVGGSVAHAVPRASSAQRRTAP